MCDAIKCRFSSPEVVVGVCLGLFDPLKKLSKGDCAISVLEVVITNGSVFFVDAGVKEFGA